MPDKHPFIFLSVSLVSFVEARDHLGKPDMIETVHGNELLGMGSGQQYTEALSPYNHKRQNSVNNLSKLGGRLSLAGSQMRTQPWLIF